MARLCCGILARREYFARRAGGLESRGRDTDSSGRCVSTDLARRERLAVFSPAKMKYTVVFVSLLTVLCLQQGEGSETNSATSSDALLGEFGRREPRVHDPSTIVKCKDEF